MNGQGGGSVQLHWRQQQHYALLMTKHQLNSNYAIGIRVPCKGITHCRYYFNCSAQLKVQDSRGFWTQILCWLASISCEDA
jgi:hypothetical protein